MPDTVSERFGSRVIPVVCKVLCGVVLCVGLGIGTVAYREANRPATMRQEESVHLDRQYALFAGNIGRETVFRYSYGDDDTAVACAVYAKIREELHTQETAHMFVKMFGSTDTTVIRQQLAAMLTDRMTWELVRRDRPEALPPSDKTAEGIAEYVVSRHSADTVDYTHIP